MQQPQVLLAEPVDHGAASTSETKKGFLRSNRNGPGPANAPPRFAGLDALPNQAPCAALPNPIGAAAAPGGGGEQPSTCAPVCSGKPRGTRSCLGAAGRRSPPPLGSITSQFRGTLIESGTQPGLEGLAARPLRWSVTRASGSLARPLTVSRRSVSGLRSTARGAGKRRNAADGPGRRALVP